MWRTQFLCSIKEKPIEGLAVVREEPARLVTRNMYLYSDGNVIMMNEREDFHLLLRGCSFNKNKGFPLRPGRLRPPAPPFYVLPTSSLEGWRVVDVGNCFKHLTESVGKFWPASGISSSPYLRETSQA
ncbi:unnamed protein product [Lasius platythorax]|uniref:Uncharacterized protein n=1 Tax=Lasius platythorax TaxID=488582 RepID=A0AAV2NFH3_9HYME